MPLHSAIGPVPLHYAESIGPVPFFTVCVIGPVPLHSVIGPVPVIFKYSCHRRLPKQHEQQQPRDDQELFATPVMGLTSGLEKRFVLTLIKSVAPARLKPILKIGLSLIAVALTTGGPLGIGSNTIGFKVESPVPPDPFAHRALEPLRGFTNLPSEMGFYELDVPEQQR